MKPSFGIALLVAASCMPLAAQHAGGAHFPGRTIGIHTGFERFGRGRAFPLYPGLGYYDSLYPGSLYSDYQPQPPQPPQVVVVQPSAPERPTEVPPPAQPLLIELRGDSYVQVTGERDTKSQTIAPESAAAKTQTQAIAKAQSQPALLIFRDGHEEEVANYTISNGMLYASADYYSAGSWNREIRISSLNVPQTIATNQSRGVPFHLPSAPNEVVVGP